MEGFAEQGEVVGGAAGIVLEVDGVGMAGEEKDLAVGDELFDGDCEIDAAHSVHEDVCDEVVGGDDLRDGERFFRVVCGDGDVVLFAEDRDEGVGDEWLVVDDQDYGPVRGSREMDSRGDFREWDYFKVEVPFHGKPSS